MTARGAATRLAWTLWAFTMVVVALTLLFLVLGFSTPTPAGAFGFRGFSALFALSFGTVGALIASRHPKNPIGWIFIAMGLASAFQELCQLYAIWSVLTNGSTALPGRAAAWFPSWIWIPITSGAAYLLLLFPTGRLPSPRWKIVVWIEIIGTVIGSVAYILLPGPLQNFSPVNNPFGAGSNPILLKAGAIGQTIYGFGIILAAVSLVMRFRRSRGVEREQLKWLAAAGILLAITLATSFLLVPVTTRAVTATGSITFGVSILVIIGFMSVPIATGIGILRYQLFDIDLVINKTVVYGILAAFITGVYVAIVVGIGALVGAGGKPNVALSIAATAIVAVAFQPVRERVQHFANRLIYGKRATPYEVMADFSHRMAGTLSADQVLPQMAEAAAAGVGASVGKVTLVLPDGGERVELWPSGSQEPAAFVRAIDITHAGRSIGEVAVAKPLGESLTPAEDELLSDLAGQAGLALYNARLTVELQARLEQISRQASEIRRSRQRIVAARDAALRQLELDIEGGTQQQLLAIGARLRAVTDIVERDPDAAAAQLDELGEDANGALETLRDLARGIFPPLLADKGLLSALEAHINKSGLPATIRTEGTIGRYDAGVEAAAYFCCIEAMQNAAKHAPGAAITVSIAVGNDAIALSVHDEGPGFDPNTLFHRAGLQNMADRLEALGGTLEIESDPVGGTRISGSVPARELEAAP